MFPLVNGKSLIECNEDDLAILIDNVDYRENEYIDYKKTFAFLEIPKEKKKELEEHKAEFRHDICSFANMDGGYYIVGIGEENGCASIIEGIEIPDNDTDGFELTLRNILSGIQPKPPHIKVKCIPLKNEKYVVVRQVYHDSFARYAFFGENRQPKFFKRYGNGKREMMYQEIRFMFNQSLSLEQSIREYTKQRIVEYRDIGSSFGTCFIHISFIPEYFMDKSYYRNMFALVRKARNVNYSSVFIPFGCYDTYIPCVDGLRYIPYSESRGNSEGYLKNNGIVEICMALDDYIKNGRYPDGFLPWSWLWDRIAETYTKYIEVFKTIVAGERVFICLSLVGCKGVTTENQGFEFDYMGKIDRDEVICEPIEIRISDEEEAESAIKKLLISYLLAIGVKHDKRLISLIDTVYGEENG